MSDKSFSKTDDLAVVNSLEEGLAEVAWPTAPHRFEIKKDNMVQQNTARTKPTTWTRTKPTLIKLLIGLLAAGLLAAFIFGPEELISVESASSKPSRTSKMLPLQPTGSGSKVLPSNRILNLLKRVSQPSVYMPLFFLTAFLIVAAKSLVTFIMSQVEGVAFIDGEGLEMAAPAEATEEPFEDNFLDPQTIFYIGYGCFGAFLLFSIFDIIIYYKNLTVEVDIVDLPRYYFGKVFGGSALANRFKMIIWLLFMALIFVAAPIGFALTASLIMTMVFQVWVGLVFIGFCVINLIIPTHYHGRHYWLNRLVKPLKRINVRVFILMCILSVISSAVGGVFGIVLAIVLTVFFTAFILHFHSLIPSKWYMIPWILMTALQIANLFVAFPYSAPVYLFGHIIIYIIFKRVKVASKTSDDDGDDHNEIRLM